MITSATRSGAHGLWTVDFFRNNNHGHAEEGADGVALGAFGGYNYQFYNNLVIGAEDDVGFTTAAAPVNNLGSIRTDLL